MTSDPLPSLYLSHFALWALVILHSLILLGLVRIVYSLQRTGALAGTHGLSAGQEAPVFHAVDLHGRQISAKRLAGRLRLLLFVSPDCTSCRAVLEDDLEYLNDKAGGNLIVICRGGREDCVHLVGQMHLNIPVIADVDDQISLLHSVSSVPTAVLVDPNDRIRSYGQPDREILEAGFEEVTGREQGAAQHGAEE